MSSGWATRRPQAGSAADRDYRQAWRQLRVLVLDRDNWWCQVRVSAKCVPNLRYGARNAHVDHVVPRAQGGTDHPSNLRACCMRCNLHLGAQLGRQRQQQAKQRSRSYRVW